MSNECKKARNAVLINYPDRNTIEKTMNRYE